MRVRGRGVKLHASPLAFVLHVCILPQALSLSPITPGEDKRLQQTTLAFVVTVTPILTW